MNGNDDRDRQNRARSSSGSRNETERRTTRTDGRSSSSERDNRREPRRTPTRPTRNDDFEGKSKKGKKNKKKKSVIGTIFKVLVAVVLIVAFAIGGASLGTVMGILNDTQVLNITDVTPESYTSLIYDSNGIEIDKLHGEENREYMSIDRIPDHVVKAAVAIEDERFYEHNGIDFRGILRAFVENIRTKSIAQGASTLTQQLIKNEVLTSEQTIIRKVQEMYMAVNLEKSLETQLGSKQAAKDYILELYLNTMSLSHGLHGIEAASQYYYGKNSEELSIAEGAALVGVTKNPSLYAPDTNPVYNKERQTLVLNKMLELNFITQYQYNEAIAEDVYSSIVSETYIVGEPQKANHNYFVEAMIDQIAVDLVEQKNFSRTQAYNLIYSGGLKIHSTIDTNIQDILEKEFLDDSNFPESGSTLDVTYLISVLNKTDNKQTHYERNMSVKSESEVDGFVQSVKDELLDENNVLILDNITVSRSLQAAMVIMDHNSGEIKAMVGGRGEKPGDSVFNRATQGLRQQGSAMKPIVVYAPAIDMGIYMPGSIVLDEPVTYGSWSPKNYPNTYSGYTTIRSALRSSINVVAVKVYTEIGSNNIFKYAEDMGISTLVEEDRGAATALGGLTIGISNLEMTGAYATIANGGTYKQPAYYTVVYDHTGNVLLETTSDLGTRVLKETTAYLLTDMMEDVVTSGTGKLTKLNNMFTAGKTGTTNDMKDLTFYGYTPYYTAGIWMGYDMAREMNVQSAHQKIWKKVMDQVHEGLSNKTVYQPEGIVTQSFCAVSGDRPSSICALDYYGKRTHSDLATSGFSGTQNICKVHTKYTICSSTGYIHSDTCPAGTKMEVVVAVDGGKVVGAYSGEGKVSVKIGVRCTSAHDGSDGEVYEEPTVEGEVADNVETFDDLLNNNDNSSDTTQSDDYYQGPLGFGDVTVPSEPSVPETPTVTTPSEPEYTPEPEVTTPTIPEPEPEPEPVVPETVVPDVVVPDVVVPDVVVPDPVVPDTVVTTPTTPSEPEPDIVIPDGYFDSNFGIN